MSAETVTESGVLGGGECEPRLGEVHKGNNLERWGMGALAARFCPGREHKCSGGLIIPHCLKLRLFKWSGEVLWWSSIWSVGCEEVFSWKRVLGVRNPQHNYQCREREREGESAREPLALFGDSFYFFSFELAPDGEV